jgi:acetyl esterase/lipase
MHQSDVLSRPSRRPDQTLSYGSLAGHIADLWLPSATAGSAAPLVLFVHGGFWRAAYDRRHVGPLAEALAASGFAVCAPEYRRTGQQGGGWPGTFDDIRSAVAALPAGVALAADGRVDVARLILAGHSAGGHLALWAASRLGGLAGPAARAVVSLAGVCDLADCYRRNLDRGAAGDLMGGGPDQVPERYAAADPSRAVPVGIPVGLVHGTSDDRVPWQQSRDYGQRASAAGDQVRCMLLPGIGHFELIDPLSTAWPAVLAEFHAAAGTS